MATIRSSSGSNSISALRSVVLPEPVPPETRMFRREAKQGRPGGPEDRLRQRAHGRTRSSSRERAAPEPADGDGDLGRSRAGCRWRPSSRRSSRASRMGLAAGSRPSGRAMWIAARWSQAAVSPGASWGSSRPPRSTQTLPGPLIMISETSGSSRSVSRPGRNGFRWPIPLARFISVPPRGAASSPRPSAGSGVSGRRAGPGATSCRRRADRSPGSWPTARTRAA